MNPGAENKTVQDCIETLYRVFNRYRFTDMDGDPAFPGWCDPKPLLAAPLRELPPEAFETFAWKTMTTWGSADDFRHFLPRMLELLVNEVEPSGFSELPFERWLLFSRLAYGKWRQWPSAEIEAIEEFTSTWGRHLICLEYGLDKLEKQYSGAALWFSEQWEPQWDFARAFLTDLGELKYPEISNRLKTFWADEIETNNSLGPISNLAKVYVSEHGLKPSELDSWFKQPERAHALYNAWTQYQDHEPLGAFFSDAHANAELACSQ